MTIWNRTFVLVATVAALLTGCGGGNSNPATPEAAAPPEVTLAQGSLASSVIVMPSTAAGLAANVQALSDTEGGLSFARSAGSAELATARVGSVVVLPPDRASGLPEGFAGVVTALDGNRVTLKPAAVEEVFDKLSLKFNTDTPGTQIKATYVPSGTRLTLSGQPGAGHQIGLDTTNTLSATADGKINGSLVVSQDFTVDGQKVTLQAVVNMKDFALAGELDFDKEKFLKQAIVGDPWFHTKLGISGTYDSKVSIKTSSGRSVTMNIADIFRQQSVWDDLKFNSKYFALEGLGGNAKKGRWAIGGIALTPVGVVKMTQNNIAIKGNSGLSVVLWMYIDSSGTVTLEGEMGVKSLPASLDVGAEFSATGATYAASRWNKSKIKDFEAPFIASSVKFKGRFGLSTDLDIFVLGIRPASFGAFAGSTLDASVEGYAAYAPFAAKWAGWVCGSVGLKAGLQTYGDIRLKVRLSPGEPEKAWWSFNQGFEYSMPADDTYMGDYIKALVPNADGGTCVTSDRIDFTSQELGPDADPTRARVLIDFAASFTDAGIRTQANTWSLRAGTADAISIPSTSDGRVVLSLPRGSNTNVQLTARSSKYGDVGLIANHDITIAPGPTLDFSAWYSLTDCRQVTVDPNVYAPRGVKAVEWTISGPGASTIKNQSTSKFQTTLSECGDISITGKVTDAGSYWAQATRTLNTLIPPITTQPGQDAIVITPTEVTVGELTTFTLTTKVIDLPDTIFMQLPECSPSPMQQLPGGDAHKRQYSCTPQGAGGARTGMIKSKPDTIYGSAFTVNVIAASAGVVPSAWQYPKKIERNTSKGSFSIEIPTPWIVSNTSNGRATYDVGVGNWGNLIISHQNMRVSGIESDVELKLSGASCVPNYNGEGGPNPALQAIGVEAGLQKFGLVLQCKVTTVGVIRVLARLKSTGEVIFDQDIEIMPNHTKISNSGKILDSSTARGFGPSDWGCTRINKTGTIVMLHDDAGVTGVQSPRPGYPVSSNLYSIFDRNKPTALASSLKMCGRSDWRVPKDNEIWPIMMMNVDQSIRVFQPNDPRVNRPFSVFWVFEVGAFGDPWYALDYGSSKDGTFALLVATYQYSDTRGVGINSSDAEFFVQPVAGP